VDFVSVRETGQRVCGSFGVARDLLRDCHAWDCPYSNGFVTHVLKEARRKIPRMKEVAVELDPEHGGPVTEALLAAGFPSAGAAPWARVVTARDVTFEDAGRDVEWVLAGGVLAICGGTGPLLSALALTPGDGPVTGPVEALAPGAPPLRGSTAWASSRAPSRTSSRRSSGACGSKASSPA